MAPRLPAPEYGHYDMLLPQQRSFVDEYLTDLNARGAALRAGYTNTVSGYRLLHDPDVQAAIEECRARAAQSRGMHGGEFVLNKLWDVATADARELVELHYIPCRYCWGVNGQYQFTKTEMDRLYKAHELGCKRLPLEAMWPSGDAEYAYYTAGSTDMPFDPQGGDGYTRRRQPNPECSECHGEGILKQRVADTRKLSHGARQLYRGAKLNANGSIEVMLANQDAARDILARHYSVGVERKAVLVQHIDPRQLSDDELIRAIADAETTLLEIESANESHEVEIVDQQRAVTLRHSQQLNAARARAAKTGMTMVRRPRG